jgi:hypothetical protein
MRRLLAICILVLLLDFNSPSQIGNFSIGGLPCVVACGDKGVINLRAPGELINNYLGGPTVDNFHDQSMNVVNEADKKLNATLDKQRDKLTIAITEQREALVKDLRDVSSTSLGDLDKILGDRLDQVQEAIGRAQYDIRAAAEKWTTTLQATLQRVVILFAVVTFLALLMWSVYRELGTRKRRSVSAPIWKRVALAAVGCVVFWWVSGLLITFSLRRNFADQEKQWKMAYEDSLKRDDFQMAIYWSSGLQTLNPASLEYEGLNKKATLLRDIFLRPSIYKSNVGMYQIYDRISQAEQILRKAGQNRDPDLDVLRALVSWQNGTERFTEYVAATACASALERSTADSPFPTRPVAAFYLRSYLANPLSDDDLKTLGFDVKQQSAALPEHDGFRYMTVAELRQILAANPEQESGPFAARVQFGTLARAAYRKAISEYLELAFTEARLSASPDPEKVKLRLKRKDLAAKITAVWAKFEREVEKRKLYDVGLQSAIIRSQFAIFERAAAYEATDASDAVPAAAVDDEKTVVSKWLKSSIKPSVSDSTFAIFGTAAKSDFRDQETKLKGFEEILTTYFTALSTYKTQKPPHDITTLDALVLSLQNANRAASSSALFGCGTDENAISCDDPTETTIPAFEIIRQSMPQDVVPSGVDPDVRKDSMDLRVLPVV